MSELADTVCRIGVSITDTCRGYANSLLCAAKDYLCSIARTASNALDNALIHFAAFGLRLLLETAVLCIYIDIHSTYKWLPINKKLELAKEFSFSATISRSTLFRRALIEIFGSEDGRGMVNTMRKTYKKLSQYIHTPVLCVDEDKPTAHAVGCVNILEELKAVARELSTILEKLAYLWLKRSSPQ